MSGITEAGDPVTEVEELHVSSTEGVIEWGVVSEVRGMAGNMTWAPGLCPEDACSRDNSSERHTTHTTVISPVTARVDPEDISYLSRLLNMDANQLFGVFATTASSIIESDMNFERQPEGTRTREESEEFSNNSGVSKESKLQLKFNSTPTTESPHHHHGVTSSSLSPTLVFSLGPDAAGQDSLIFSVKPEHEYVTTTPSSSGISSTFPDHGSTEEKET